MTNKTHESRAIEVCILICFALFAATVSARNFLLARPGVVYASSVAALDSNIETGGGTDDTAALQAILDTAPKFERLHLIVDGVALVSGLNVGSNTTISSVDGGGLYLKAGSNRAAIRNLNRTSGAIVDKNITLTDLVINGNYGEQAKYEKGGLAGREVYQPGTIFNCAVQLFGVANLTTHNLKVVDSKNFSIHIANFVSVSMDGTWVVVNQRMQDNHDGIHLNGPGRDLKITNTRLTGTTDDGIALNADDGTACEFIALGPIANVLIDGLFLDQAAFGVRVISNTSRVDNITIKNVHGQVQNYVLHIDDLSYYPGMPGHGSIGSVTLDGVYVAIMAGREPFWAETIRVEAHIENLKIKNFKQADNVYARARPVMRILEASSVTGEGEIKTLDSDLK